MVCRVIVSSKKTLNIVYIIGVMAHASITKPSKLSLMNISVIAGTAWRVVRQDLLCEKSGELGPTTKWQGIASKNKHNVVISTERWDYPSVG